ncbi:MAG: hypothetical protein ACI9F9_003395, partial [Candidatus Paceibacteria bacterium]
MCRLLTSHPWRDLFPPRVAHNAFGVQIRGYSRRNLVSSLIMLSMGERALTASIVASLGSVEDSGLGMGYPTQSAAGFGVE